MSLSPDSKYYSAYCRHISGDRNPGIIGLVYDLIKDLTDRSGLGDEWCSIDGDIQDEIIETWYRIINSWYSLMIVPFLQE